MAESLQKYSLGCIVKWVDGKLGEYKYVRNGKYIILNTLHYFYYLSLSQPYEALDTNIKTKIRNFSVEGYCSVCSACSVDSKALTQTTTLFEPLTCQNQDRSRLTDTGNKHMVTEGVGGWGRTS